MKLQTFSLLAYALHVVHAEALAQLLMTAVEGEPRNTGVAFDHGAAGLCLRADSAAQARTGEQIARLRSRVDPKLGQGRRRY